MAKLGGIKTPFSIIILIFLVIGGNLFAGGGREDPVDTARALILEKRYNEALLILAEVARKDPRRLDEAEGLIRRIRNLRGEYNDKYEELIHVLYEERDVAKALKIIDELESLDKNPNPATRSAILRAKESARFVYNQERFIDIMTRAAEMLEKKDYWGAAALYLTGFDIGREEFDRAGYGNIITGRVDGALAEVRQASDAFIRGREIQVRAAESLKTAAGSNNPEALGAAVLRYREAFRTVASVFKTALLAAESLQEQNRRVGTIREGIREDFFLGYTQRLSAGRHTAASPEGIKGAAESSVARLPRPGCTRRYCPLRQSAGGRPRSVAESCPDPDNPTIRDAAIR